MNWKKFTMVTITFWLVTVWSYAEELPKDIEWITNDTAPVYADPNALKGGTYRDFMLSFPLTIRLVGPDSNSSFASAIRGNNMFLISIHPNTQELLPSLATHWAYSNDNKTMYFKLDRQARWSDGQPVTADDYLYTIEFMRSPHIIAPWYNNHYSKEIEKVVKYDEDTIAVVATKPKPDLYLTTNISPTPQHFYGELKKDFVRKYNWKIIPNTGPYQIDKIKKGKSITFKRKKNWWAKEFKYHQGRFNVDTIVFQVIRDTNTVFEYFKRGRLDSYIMTFPSRWHQQAKGVEIFEKGYAKRIWFYTDSPQPSYGLWLNQDIPLFQDRSVVHAFAHAMNMKKLLKEVLRGDYLRLHNHYTGYGKYTNPNVQARPYDLKKVAELMTASGWQRGKDGIWVKGKQRFSVKVNYSFDGHTPRLVLLKEEAKKAGVEMKLQKMDGSSSFKLTQEKKHEVAWTGYSTGIRPRYWQMYHSENAHKPQTNNITNTDDPALDKLIEQYRASNNAEERIKLSWIIQEKIHEIGAYVPTYMVPYFRTGYWRWWQVPKVAATKWSDGLLEPFGTAVFWFDPKIKEATEEAMELGKIFAEDVEPVIDTTFRNNGS